MIQSSAYWLVDKHLGYAPLPMSALFRQGRDARDDLVVFTVKRVWIENGGPHAEVEVERVEVGYRKEKIGVDLTKQKGAQQ